jgi:uncharacterized LabA/DUF88 family protein
MRLIVAAVQVKNKKVSVIDMHAKQGQKLIQNLSTLADIVKHLEYKFGKVVLKEEKTEVFKQ